MYDNDPQTATKANTHARYRGPHVKSVVSTEGVMPSLTTYSLTYLLSSARSGPLFLPLPTPTPNSDPIPSPSPSLNRIVSPSPNPEQARSLALALALTVSSALALTLSRRAA